MKIVHAADAHLGFSAFTPVDSVTGINVRSQDVVNSWNDFIDKALLEKPDVVLFCGDLFDLPVVKNFAINAALRLLMFECPVLIISGNHDRSIRGDVSPVSFLRMFPNITALTNEDRPTSIEIEGKTFSLYPNAIKGNPVKGDILLAHGCVIGPEEYTLAAGYLDLCASDYEYVALGDLHRFYRSEHVVYPGALSKLTFTQEKVRCGFVVYDTATKEVRHVPTISREFVTVSVDRLEDPNVISALDNTIVRVLIDKAQQDVDSIYEKLSSALHVKIKRIDVDEIVSSHKVDTSKENTIETSYVEFCVQTDRTHLSDPGLELIRSNMKERYDQDT